MKRFLYAILIILLLTTPVIAQWFSGGSGGSVTGMAADGSVPFTGVIETVGVEVKNGATSPGFVDFYEDSSNGTHYHRLYGAEALADSIFTRLWATAGNTGGLLYFSAANQLAVAAAGTEGQLWIMGATIPGWSAVPTWNQNTTGTAAALTANGANCDAGSAPLGVDASGAAESCFAVQPADADLTAIAALSCTENQIIKRNGAGAWACAADADSAGTPTAITVADTTDTTSYVALFESATGDLGPKTDGGILYNAGTGLLTVTGISVGSGGVTVAASASPTQLYLDSDAPGADKEIAKTVQAYVDGADGAENGTYEIYVHQAGTSTSYIKADGKNTNVRIVPSLLIGPAAPNDVQPTFSITGDADSDAAGDTTETITFTLAPNADPTLAKWNITSTQSAGYTFDKPVQAPAKFVSFAGAATLTAAAHNGALVMMTTADEVTMWDCTTSTIGHFVTLWARDAEKIEVVPASGDQFYLFNGTGIGANDELDIAATAGTKVTLMCTAENEWRVVFETAACADGGAAD